MPVVQVVSSFCDSFTGGLNEIEVEAGTVGGMFRELDRRFPGFGEFLEAQASVAIDGEIHQQAWAEPIGPESEIFLIPRIGGG